MSKKEIKHFRLAMDVLENRLSITEFSFLIEKSYRQSQRIIKKVENLGELGVIHGNTARPPINKSDQELLSEVHLLHKNKYFDFNLTHFFEHLQEKESISGFSYSTLYRYSKPKGMIKNIKRRSKRKFSTRPRLPKEGMLIQFDGSEHLWFGGFKSDLIAGIDDATGKIIAAEFFIGETSLHSMKVIKDITMANGVPEAFYMDEAAIYGKIDRDWQSQIKRALEDINSKLIIATSPQAKGRVERLFRTLQDRLIAEFRLLDIKTVPQANNYLQTVFIPMFNKKFSVDARVSEKAYTPLNIHENYELIFCRKESRKITAGNTFSHKATTYLLKANKNYAYRTVYINSHYDGRVTYDIMGKEVQVEIFKAKESKIEKEAA